MRVARLERPDMHVQTPPSRTVHHVSAIEILDNLEIRSALIVAEWRAGEARWFAGRVTHRLRREEPGLRIVLKRVDLIDSEAPHRALAVPL
jgi:benzoate/toluate 1,2-dioxygenase beta subunit